MTESGPAPRSAARLTWAPRPGVVVLGWVVAVLLLAAALLASMPEGRILAGIGALAAGLFALFGTVARPRLAVDADGLSVRRLGALHSWPWARVTIRTSRTRRLGRAATLLEIDVAEDDDTERLIVLGWLDLGTDPEDVIDAIRALRT